MSRDLLQLYCRLLFVGGLYATIVSLGANANMEEELKPTIAQPSIEILALSRGRGVPETTMKVFQEIMAIADSALETRSAVSVKRATIGLEGETRLCIVFQDNQALDAIGKQIRKLATNIDLLQVNDNSCSIN